MEEKKTYDFLAGEILLINKPYKWTSFDAVNKIRWLIKQKLGVKKIKVGHAGTLDPLATGLLIICTGKFTKKIAELQGKDKVYTATFKLGATTPSYDLESEIDKEYPTQHITEEKVKNIAQKFIGEQEQYPPAFSAKWINGERAYVKARKGEEVKLSSKMVNIKQMEVLKTNLPEVELKVECTTGTYIRSLARDFGKALDSGAHLTELERTSVGDYKIEDALDIEQFEEKLKDSQIESLPAAQAGGIKEV